MPSKATGAIHIGVCQNCGDELKTGWLRSDAERIFIRDLAKVIDVRSLVVLGVSIPVTSVSVIVGSEMIATGPLACSCGNVSARFELASGRTLYTWVTEEPVVGNFNLH